MKAIWLLYVLAVLRLSRACTTMTSTWRINNLPVAGNNIELRFQRRLNSAGACLHYFRFQSLCTRYEATYTSSHSLLVVPYTINGVSLHPVNLAGCPNLSIAAQEATMISNFYPPPKTGWYHLFWPPFILLNQEKLAWGGYIADWVSGTTKRVWWPWSALHQRIKHLFILR